jgi:hypothetical protein
MHQKSETDRLFSKSYLKGAVDGLLAYETFVAKAKNGTPLFCLSPKLAITDDQVEEIMLRWLKEQTADTKELPISMALLWGLEETFPCGK